MPRALLPTLLVPVMLATAACETRTPFEVQADAMLASRYDAKGPSGAVLVARDGKVLFRKAYGLANVEQNRPNSPEATFHIGSMTKMFTAAATLLLVEDGKVDLKAPVSKYLEGLPETWKPLTVESLLNHTSGLPDYHTTDAFRKDLEEGMLAANPTPRRILERYAFSQPMGFPSGAKYDYNNTGFLLLGMIIEKASGQPWDAFLKARILTPLGMAHTRLGNDGDYAEEATLGYYRGQRAPRVDFAYWNSAGGLVSTLDDMAVWMAGLLGGKVLKPETLARMLTPTRTTDGKTHPYGYGIESHPFEGHTILGHSGHTVGMRSLALADPATRSVFVMLNNTTHEAKGQNAYYGKHLLAMAMGKPIVLPPVAAVSKAQLEVLAGTYQGQMAPATFTVEKGKLFKEELGRKVKLLPISPVQFRIEGQDGTYTFKIEGGRVLGHTYDSQELGRQPRFLQRVELQPALPDTPYGRVARAFLDAYNSGDPARLAQFSQAHDAKPWSDGFCQSLVKDRQMTGELSVAGAAMVDDRTLLAQFAKGGRRLTVTFFFKADGSTLVEDFDLAIVL